MNVASIFESLYTYLYKVGVYNQAKVASYVGLKIDEAAYKRITGDDYVASTAK
ncbi:MAG: XkdX family protein [Lactobacillus sp.]|nr:XkdX family protein [Lactobacillus sp.]